MSDSNSNRVGSVSDSVNGEQGSRNNDSSRERQPLEYEPTGRTELKNLNEQIAMKAAKADAANGETLKNIVLRDARWSPEGGWVKKKY
ncbi:unnamed protein product [Rotaria magnacalcarata]|uniref:Uncharacterized protein n=2 Tax=Rotaria magnacalcarata TaxID=392030 RepID=A0A819S8S7_9BILA|nr:unnamed protein product [Rotaria magnacalcarata]CAF2086376.1 unnamed protein product [Rotaria magnacalcarata]CAF3814823.1 unnamed protein product [Rotaria magnacalcarata]CAF4057584.1 unnamed protein product [Rotaria magnacalcarata]